jgi:hypothetical protein
VAATAEARKSRSASAFEPGIPIGDIIGNLFLAGFDEDRAAAPVEGVKIGYRAALPVAREFIEDAPGGNRRDRARRL